VSIQLRGISGQNAIGMPEIIDGSRVTADDHARNVRAGRDKFRLMCVKIIGANAGRADINKFITVIGPRIFVEL
jgi:hypothetical protein